MAEIFSSTIIPTVNRPTLTGAVCSVLDQSFQKAGIEIIVVNDSGLPLPEMDWQHAECVKIVNTNRHERCVARNTGAAIARGAYLHFLDDDDVLLPGALEAFWSLKEGNAAPWMYGAYQTVDNNGAIVDEFYPGIVGNIFAMLVAGEGVPLQASLIKTEAFFDAQAFHLDLVGVEDRDLGRRLALLGEIAYTPNLVARIRIGEQGSTTNWAVIAENDRIGREKALSARNAGARARQSAKTSYWRGRLCRAYFASAVWNLHKKSLYTATSRSLTSLGFLGSRQVLTPYFWSGLKGDWG